MTKRKKDLMQPEPTLPASAYEPTLKERAALVALDQRRKDRPARVGIKVSMRDGVTKLRADHPDLVTGSAILMNSIGTSSNDFANGFVQTLLHATTAERQPQERHLNDALATVQALGPRDEAEAMLAAQMAMVHDATAHAARRLRHAVTVEQIEAHDRCLNRLARTYAAQLEALKRYRTGGQQRMTVEHVHVHAGGQAIVGSVNHGGGGELEKRGQPHD